MDDPAVPVQVALRGLAEREHGPGAVAEAMHGERARWRRAGDRHLMVLGTLGNNVPFIGLFGTVLGVINAFQHLTVKTADAEAADAAHDRRGARRDRVGLLVAIPAVIAFNTFTRKLKVVMGSADECAHGVLSLVYGAEHAAPATETGDLTMAGGSLYQDEEGHGITDINVTPFVDVVLVILVVFIVTAKLIVARGRRDRQAEGGDRRRRPEHAAGLRATRTAQLFVNGDKFTTDAAAIARVKEIAATSAKPKAIIAGSKAGAYGNVMRAIDVVQQAGVTSIALENERL